MLLDPNCRDELPEVRLARSASAFGVQDVVCAQRHVLILSGELDMASVTMLDGVVERVCSRGADALVLDLRGLTFMDCSGIHAILRAQELCVRQDRCWFALIPGSNRQVTRVLQLTGLLDHFASGARARFATPIRRAATPNGAAPDRLAARTPRLRREPTIRISEGSATRLGGEGTRPGDPPRYRQVTRVPNRDARPQAGVSADEG
jgi:anti-anti-sigma factor